MSNGIDATRTPIVRLTETNEAMADSRDVAAYFGKEHRSVLASIDKLLSQDAELALHDFVQGSYQRPETGPQEHRRFDMTRDGFTLLAMGFTGGKALKWKRAYIHAFNVMESELRSRPAFDPTVALNDPAWLRNTLTVYTEKVIALEAANKEMSADVAALDRIAKADGSLNVTEAAKALQIRPKALFQYLSAHGWIYRRAGSDHWLGYQSRVQSGDLEHKVTTVLRADGSEKVTEQVRVTPKGLAKLAKLFPPSMQAVA